jgi:chaperonin cofactor prefoldin
VLGQKETGGNGSYMTLRELSVEYRAQAQMLQARIRQLEAQIEQEEEEFGQLQARIRMLSTMQRQARELALLTERYYDKGFYRNGKYTI